MSNEPNWDKLGDDLNLKKLSEKLMRPEQGDSPYSLMRFAKEWGKIGEEGNPSIEITLTVEVSGDEGRAIKHALLFYKFLKERNETRMTQKEFLQHMFMSGVLGHCMQASLVVQHAKMMHEYLKHVRDNPQEFKEALNELIEGKGDFADYADEDD